MNESLEYRAYISYSHGDEKFAAWLHSALESWKLPRRIARGFAYKHLRPVFRDRSDLRASSSLPDALKSALRRSESMIVVCSDAAAKSSWVNEEIRYFREVHGGDRIFAIICDGEPPACFPLEILASESGDVREPIASDARKNFDGRKDALLKTIAAVLNVPFDDLKRRDLRRRYRLMSGIAVMSTLVATSMLLLALVANDARQDANRRRSQAEDLISFMVGDLREKLEPVGRLDVLDAVGDKSLDYFASLDDEELTPETLLRRAQALRQIGEVRMFQGKLKEAEDAFRLSHDQARRIRSSHQDVSAVEFELCQSLFYMGYAQYERGNFEDAKEHFASYLHIAQRLHDREPDNERYLREVSYAQSNLGSLELKLDNLSQARVHFAATSNIQRGFVEANPDDLHALKDYVETISWLGEIASREMDVLEAMDRFKREHELRQKIVAELDDRHQEEKLADAAILLAHQEALAGKLEDSVTHWNGALVIGHRLVDYDPENVYWRRLRAYSALGLSKTRALQNRLKRSEEHLEFALGEFAELRRLDRESMVARIDFLDATVQTALTSRLGGDQDKFRLSVGKGMSLVNSPEYLPVSVDSYALIAQLHLLHGDVFELQGLIENARASWRAGLELTSSQELSSRTLFARLLELTLMRRLRQQSDDSVLLHLVNRTGISEEHIERIIRVLIEGVSRRVDTTGGQHDTQRTTKDIGHLDSRRCLDRGCCIRWNDQFLVSMEWR